MLRFLLQYLLPLVLPFLAYCCTPAWRKDPMSTPRRGSAWPRQASG